MVQITTDRLKFNKPLGNLPALQYLLPEQLQIDQAYQRSIDTNDSQALIRRIAQHWNWDLCQPLVVARRDDGGLFVIDGQHRLAAARLRGDIAQLPAVVVMSGGAADEAASFVHLNQQRRPLSRLQVFRAAVASGDSTATAIIAAIEAAGLRLGRSSQLETSPPGTINNVGGLQAAWAKVGAAAASEALQVLATAFAGEKLLYAGTLYPGIAAICAREMRDASEFPAGRFAMFTAMLGGKGQAYWRTSILQARAANPNLNYAKAGVEVIGAAWAERAPAATYVTAPPPAPKPVPAPSMTAPLSSDPVWCDQCEQRVLPARAAMCESAFCKAKGRC